MAGEAGGSVATAPTRLRSVHGEYLLAGLEFRLGDTVRARIRRALELEPPLRWNVP